MFSSLKLSCEVNGDKLKSPDKKFYLLNGPTGGSNSCLGFCSLADLLPDPEL